MKRNTKKTWLVFLMLAAIAGGLWAQDAADSSSANKVAFTVEVTYMTQGGTKTTDSILVFAADPRVAEREAEEQFKKTNSHSTFIRAVATVDAAYLDKSERTSYAPSASRSVSPNSDGKLLFSVKVTYMTQGGTKRIDTIVVQSADPRAAEREAEAQFRKTNSRSTFISAVTE